MRNLSPEVSPQSRSGGLTYIWDFDQDGQPDAKGANPSYTYEQPGNYEAQLTVTDSRGAHAETHVPISVGNTAPSLSIEWPVNGGIVDFGKLIDYRVAMTDAESSPVSKEVVVQPLLGHDTHTHALQRHTGRNGTFQIYSDTSHMYLENRFAVLTASYTDDGATGVDPLTAEARLVLQPRRKQAEHATSVRHTNREIVGSLRTRDNVHVFHVREDGSYLSYAPVNLLNIASLTFRVASEAGGTIEVRLDEPGGRLLAEAQVKDSTAYAESSRQLGQAIEGEDEAAAAAEALSNWTTITVPIKDPGGTHELFLVFRGKQDATLMKLDWFEFNGEGAMSRTSVSSR